MTACGAKRTFNPCIGHVRFAPHPDIHKNPGGRGFDRAHGGSGRRPGSPLGPRIGPIAVSAVIACRSAVSTFGPKPGILPPRQCQLALFFFALAIAFQADEGSIPFTRSNAQPECDCGFCSRFCRFCSPFERLSWSIVALMAERFDQLVGRRALPCSVHPRRIVIGIRANGRVRRRAFYLVSRSAGHVHVHRPPDCGRGAPTPRSRANALPRRVRGALLGAAHPAAARAARSAATRWMTSSQSPGARWR